MKIAALNELKKLLIEFGKIPKLKIKSKVPNNVASGENDVYGIKATPLPYVEAKEFNWLIESK
jgi:hypothetical protein